MKKMSCQAKNIIIRRVLHSHTIRLSVNRSGQIVLRIPFLCPKRMALSFLNKQADWIKEQQNKQANPLIFTNGQKLSVLGQPIQIQHNPLKHFSTHICGDYLMVSGDLEFLDRRVTDFIKRQTQAYIQKRASALAEKIGCSVHRIALKDTTSRWGSCSGKNNLNFCWRLGMAPLYVLDYIIAHEVAHLKEMNHSPNFWKVVSTLCDNRSSAEIWLRRHGHTLREQKKVNPNELPLP